MTVSKSESCDVDLLTKVVKSHIPEATIEGRVGADISYLLPFRESKKFKDLFLEIELMMSELGVNSYGIFATTMEEVFLK